MIYGFEGGIGSGKTLSVVALGLIDLYDGKKIYSNIKLKNVRAGYRNKIEYLTKDKIKQMFELIKAGKLNMLNSTVLMQEAHNYLDSRRSMFKDNRMLSYWILQSRHTGQGTCDIIYDTQELRQVDVRLRNNTDVIGHPFIREWTRKGKVYIPKTIIVRMSAKVGHRYTMTQTTLDVTEAVRCYDTHELVDF